jgi:hypothetical protein
LRFVIFPPLSYFYTSSRFTKVPLKREPKT